MSLTFCASSEIFGHTFVITQKDIAKRLGISASLVSRALTGKAGEIGASEQTVRRIREEALRAGYRPSAAALTLRGLPTKTFGVIVKDFEDPFFGYMIGELQSLAWEKQFSLILTGCGPGHAQDVDLTSLLKYQPDGIIMAGSDFDPQGLDVLPVRGIPVVQIGAGKPQKTMIRVSMDQEWGFDRLVDFLKRLGHRDIGYIGNDTAHNLRRERILRDVIRRWDLVTRPNAFVTVGTRDSGAGYQAMSALLQQCGELLPTAVIAADDAIAQSALRALFEKQIRVPQDLSLAGVDDIPSARMTIPALTSLRQPIRQMAREAFRLLSNAAASKARTGCEIVVKPELVVRESCAPPRERTT